MDYCYRPLFYSGICSHFLFHLALIKICSRILPKRLRELELKSIKGTPTPYPEINEVLNILLENVQAVLKEYFVGLYLYGSLASKDFDPSRSDIDFLVVITQELPANVVSSLEAMHARIGVFGLKWASKLEGVYIPRNAMWQYDPAGPICPMIHEGKFEVAQPGIDWVINRHVLYSSGVIISGPPLQQMIRPVEPSEIREAVLSLLHNNWASFLQNADYFLGIAYQPFVVLTMCRALYTLEHGIVASKKVSAAWAIAALDEKWTELIKQAVTWNYGKAPGDISQTQEFIRYALKRAGALR